MRDARVSLLHVFQGPKAASEDSGKQRANAERMLADASAELGEVRYPVERLVVDGDPAQQIVSIARSHHIDLVVLGARGLRTIGRLLLGSVSETVLHHVSCTVVIVREG